jgi:hypothetical protein
LSSSNTNPEGSATKREASIDKKKKAMLNLTTIDEADKEKVSEKKMLINSLE